MSNETEPICLLGHEAKKIAAIFRLASRRARSAAQQITEVTEDGQAFLRANHKVA